jgi:pseudo-rSAM protein
VRKYWLTLNQNVFLWQTKRSVLLYNSANGKSYYSQNHPKLRKYIADLSDLNNLYTIDILESELDNPVVNNWINGITSTNSGQLVSQSEDTLRPVSFFPFFKLQNDIDHIRWRARKGVNGIIINNLQEITVYLNGSENGNELYSKQTIYPFPVSSSIPLKSLVAFIQSCKGGMLTHINLAGNMMNYPQSEELFSWLDENQLECSVYLLATDILSNIEHFKKLQKIHQLNIICDNSLLIDKLIYLLKQNRIENVLFVFPVTSEEEYNRVIIETERQTIEYTIIPLFNGSNNVFFEEHIYTTIDDLKEMSISKREIFAHYALNVNFFGKLYILPNGHIYANLNHPALGTIDDNSIYELLYKEMDEGNSWRMIRNQMPCTDCIYQWLCPSPSNYELVLNKFNLCHITPD